jgi:hypothetical protein
MKMSMTRKANYFKRQIHIIVQLNKNIFLCILKCVILGLMVLLLEDIDLGKDKQ